MNTEIIALREILALSRGGGKSLPEVRQAYDDLSLRFPLADDVAVTEENIGIMHAEWTSTPGCADGKVMLYLHGGGFTIGSSRSHRHLTAEIGREAGIRTLSLDYRLSPEAVFPAALSDAVAGYRFLLERGFKPTSIAIVGDSAGGGLAISTLLSARDAGLPQPACVVCMSPYIDMEARGESMVSKAAEDPLVQTETVLQMAAAYLGGIDPRNPLVSPVYADFTGLPPLLIQVGSAETLLDDAVRLARLAGGQEVRVELEIWPEMIHAWHAFHPILADGRRANARIGAFIRRQMQTLPELNAAAGTGPTG